MSAEMNPSKITRQVDEVPGTAHFDSTSHAFPGEVGNEVDDDDTTLDPDHADNNIALDTTDNDQTEINSSLHPALSLQTFDPIKDIHSKLPPFDMSGVAYEIERHGESMHTDLQRIMHEIESEISEVLEIVSNIIEYRAQTAHFHIQTQLEQLAQRHYQQEDNRSQVSSFVKNVQDQVTKLMQSILPMQTPVTNNVTPQQERREQGSVVEH